LASTPTSIHKTHYRVCYRMMANMTRLKFSLKLTKAVKKIEIKIYDFELYD